MMDQKFSYWLPIAIAMASLVVAVFGIVTFRNMDAIRESERRVANSYSIRESTRELLSSMKDMETGQRGYLITGKPRYLESYYAGLEHVDENFANLRALVRDNPVQQKHLDRLETLNEDKKKYFAETIELRNLDSDSPISEELLNLVLSGRGKENMDEMRDIVLQILIEQGRVLAEQKAASEERASSSKWLIVAGNLLSLGFLLIAGVVANLDRKKRDASEAELQAKQAELASIIDASHDGIITFGRDLSIRLMNPAAASIYCVDPAQIKDKSILSLCPPDARAKYEEVVRGFFDSNDKMRTITEEVGFRASGDTFPLAGTMTKIVAGDEFVSWIVRDLSETKARQAKLREQTAILDQVRDAILVSDMESRIFYWNEGSRRLYGYAAEEVIGRSLVEILYGGDLEQCEFGRGMMIENGVYSAELTQRNRDGKEFIVEHRRSVIRDDQGIPYAQLIMNIDITQRKRDEAQHRRSQRLASIGTLSGGIAHDLNNVLTPILMSGKLIKRQGSDHERLADTIVTSAERGGQMIKKLLAFAGSGEVARERVDFASILAEVHSILAHTLPKTIELHVEGGEDLPSVNGDVTELLQVVMNLAINARDAMPNGGRLELKTEKFYVDESRAKRNDALRPGPHLLLTVSDTGEGIDRTLIDRIFDPFFTTKAQGKGTGLGLATTLGIVRSHGGDISVYSELGHGTTFLIYLPCASSQAEQFLSDLEAAAPDGNGESILLVDDEPLILETAAEMLRSHGYRVHTAASGREAIEFFREASHDVDLVVLDMMMPGMDGVATKDELRGINAKLKIIASSGLRRAGSHGERIDDFDGFLPKPYSDSQLLRVVNQTLHQTRAEE